jgi:hypothetical protein
MTPAPLELRLCCAQFILSGGNKSAISCYPVLYYTYPKPRHLHQQGEPTVYEAPAIIGTCINCISPGSLSATLALILIGAGVALAAERRKLIRARR